MQRLIERIAATLDCHRPFMDEGPNGLAESIADAIAAEVPGFDRAAFLQSAGARDEWGNSL